MLKNDNRSDEQLISILWDYLTIETPLTHADIIIVGGCDDTQTIELAIDLHQTSFAPLLLFSGQQLELADSGAAYAAKRARTRGVPEDLILREPLAKNAGQTITHTCELLEKMSIPVSSALLIHKPFMTRSFLATAEVQWSGTAPKFIVQHTQTGLIESTLRSGRGDVFRSILGEFQRIRSYGKKGYQSVQDVPNSAQIAYDTLIWRGHKTR